MGEAGFTPREALTAATRRSAELLRANDLGTLERNTWADFVVLQKDPLADIRNTPTIPVVYVAGRPVTADVLARVRNGPAAPRPSSKVTPTFQQGLAKTPPGHG
jgi:cytosine/adenosine deaminase-related metal-dependent hydrolase